MRGELPRFRIGGADVVLIPRGALRIGPGALTADELAEALTDPLAVSVLRELAEELGFTGAPEDREAIVSFLGDRIAQGDIAALVTPPSMPGSPILYSASPGSDWSDAVPLSTLQRSPDLGWISFELLDHRGVPFAGLEVELVHGARTQRLVLDARGRCTARDLEYGSTSHLVLPSRLDGPASAVGMDGFVRGPADIGVSRTPTAPVALGALDRHVRLVCLPDVHTGCVRLVGMLFELNKAFLLPGALEGIRLLAHMYQRIPNAEILVVGHTDRTGKAFRNDSLSLERARAVIAFMTDDVDAWLACYGDDMDASRRWGPTEDLAMLSSLPLGARPYYSAEHDEHSFAAAVRRFQGAHDLVVDGAPGPQTRRALVAQYMAMDGTTLPAGTNALAHGCGEHFPVVATEDGVEQLENRRVEVFFFSTGIAPAPATKNSEAGATEYPQWNNAVDEERTFTPSLAGRGTVAVATDYAIGYAHHVGLVLELRSVDGAYVRRVEPPDAADAPDELLAVTFEDVPVASFLTLVAARADGSTDMLFEDVPFAELAWQHGDDEQEDPFAVTQPSAPDPE